MSMATPEQVRTRMGRHDRTGRWMGWRKFTMLICGLAIAWPLASYAQQPKQSLKRVGVLEYLVPCPLQPDNIVIHRLAELGWIEGHTIAFDCLSSVGRVDQELLRKLFELPYRLRRNLCPPRGGTF